MLHINFYDLDKLNYDDSYLSIYMIDNNIEVLISFFYSPFIICLDVVLLFKNKLPFKLINKVNIYCDHMNDKYYNILLYLLSNPYIKFVEIETSDINLTNKILLFIPNNINVMIKH